jgi:hypothetical protein
MGRTGRPPDQRCPPRATSLVAVLLCAVASLSGGCTVITYVDRVVLVVFWSEQYADVLPVEEFFDELALARSHPSLDGPHVYYQLTAAGGEAELGLTLDAIFASLAP